MSGPRTAAPPAATFLLGLVAVVTTWLALTAWRGFLSDPDSLLGRAAVVGLVVLVLGSLLRWRAVPRWLVVLAQVVVVTAVVSWQITGSPVPSAQIGQALSTAVDTARTYSAPVGPRVPALWPLLLVCAAAFLVLVDTIACTFRRVPAAGLALLAVYSVPSGLLDRGPGWIGFALTAVGFLLMLHLDAREHLYRWGRPLGPTDRTPWHHGHPVREAVKAGAAPIGITATVLALVVPVFVPVLSTDLFDLGSGGSGGDIRIRKPIADMRRDLERGEDVPLVRLTTDDPSPSYLRISVLNRFTGQEWSSGDRDVPQENTASGALPRPAGLSESVPSEQYDYDVEVTSDLNSTWLPTQFPAAAVRADGDWRFDPSSMDFLAADDDLDTRRLSYSMTSIVPRYGTDGRYFRDAPGGAVPQEMLELPSGIPSIVRELARSVTEPAENDYERALMLQAFFRSEGGFTYDLRKAPPGTGNDTLESFLSPSGRVGYCEQYASAMAVMARVLGIPARVAVGFLQPTQLGDGRWEYSSHDLHAWPELYFSGAGWVRFEPTPAGRVQDVPDYSRVPVDGGRPDPGTATSSAAPSGTATVAPRPAPNRPTEAPAADSGQGSGSASHTGRNLAIGGGVLVVLLLAALLLLGPRSVRRTARRTRLGGGPDEHWAELHASAVDLGVPWPEGRSPREVGTVLVDHLGDPDAPPVERPRTGPDVAPRAADALERLVDAVERTRYARPGAVATALRPATLDDVECVIDALAAGVTVRDRRRAQWLPRSVWQALRRS
ncbi:transglutaminaseTgpA domain-containing protein [Nocardioides sp. LML1-1-1.1]|uniref:transglutaminase family protein n=1 Tax=Nocardioides sp. LML1-1-1.1 TaxID=3135248 RepID=UPI00344640CF